MSELKRRYREEVVPALQKEFAYSNPMQVPRVEKIVVNIGLGEALQNAKALDAAVGDLTADHRAEAVVTSAKQSIAQFQLRDRQPDRRQSHAARRANVGLPGAALALALPRIRDFRGCPVALVRRPGQLLPRAPGAAHCFPRSTTTRWTVCAGMEVRS